MSILDDLKALKKMIPCETLEGLNGLPKAITRLNSLAKKAEVKVEPEWDSVYVTGDQSGRMCGYLLQTLLLYDSKFPVYVGASEKIPDFICRKTLVFIIFHLSYDADLTARLTTRINDCVAREATIVCITEEGTNWDSIRQQGVEVLEMPKDLEYYLTNHYAFLIPLYLISKCRLARTFDIDAQEAGRDLERLKGSYSVATPLGTNPAKELATRLYQQPIVFLFGSFGVTDSIVRRWSVQLRKRHYLADCCVFPDASYEQPFLSVPGMDLYITP